MWSELTWFMWSDFALMWSGVKCSAVEWTDVIYVKWICFEENWSDVEWTDVIYVKWFCFEVKWSDVEWTDVIYVKWFWSEVKWSYSVVLGDKSAMHIRVTLHWGYLIVLWLFHLDISHNVVVLTCTVVVVNLFCNVWVCVCVSVLLICVLVWIVFCIVCTVIL
jgi:hypothetical protein